MHTFILDTIYSSESIPKVYIADSRERGLTSGYDPYDYTSMYNGYGIVREINNGGLEVVVEMSSLYNTYYPLYVSGGEIVESTYPIDGVITIKDLFSKNEFINLNSEFEDPGILATYSSTLQGINADITPSVRRYGYVNTYKTGIYQLTYSVEYLGKSASSTRYVFVTEPNWLDSIMPDELQENYELIQQFMSRFNEIYWELNYLHDNSKFNFDSRLKAVYQYNEKLKYPLYTISSTNTEYNYATILGPTLQQGDLLEILTTNISTLADNEIVKVLEIITQSIWEPSETYSEGDIVTHLGTQWYCNTSSTVEIPSFLTTDWQPCTIARLARYSRYTYNDLISYTGTGIAAVKGYNFRIDCQGYIYQWNGTWPDGYNLSTTYSYGDYVYTNFVSWKCISTTDIVNKAPLDYPEFWTEEFEAPGVPRIHAGVNSATQQFWNPEYTYMEGDLVEASDGTQWIALREPTEDSDTMTVSTNINKNPLTESTYWQLSRWNCLYNFQRIQSVSDTIAIGVANQIGIPDWLFYDLVKSTTGRVKLGKLFKFIVTSRSTLNGFSALLNVLNLTGEVYRLEPEEEIDSNESLYNAIVLDSGSMYSKRGIYDDTVDYYENDIVYSPEGYIERVYRCRTDFSAGSGSISGDTYNSLNVEVVWEYSPITGDNSYHQIKIGQFVSNTESDCIEDEIQQYELTKLAARILRFSIPDYIRYDAEMKWCNEYDLKLTHGALMALQGFDMEDIPPYSCDHRPDWISGTLGCGAVTLVDIGAGLTDDTPVLLQPNVEYDISWVALYGSAILFDGWYVKDFFGPGLPNQAEVVFGDENSESTTIKVTHQPVRWGAKSRYSQDGFTTGSFGSSESIMQIVGVFPAEYEKTYLGQTKFDKARLTVTGHTGPSTIQITLRYQVPPGGVDQNQVIITDAGNGETIVDISPVFDQTNFALAVIIEGGDGSASAATLYLFKEQE